MEKRGVKPVGTVIVEAIVDVVCFQPAAGFFNRVAILNAVHHNHSESFCSFVDLMFNIFEDISLSGI
ncbi:Uncharacterised protein [Enterobacter cloacae]|nr:Uncharacterised protein [Enterobacter cloacae]